ncbi:hypothetical protein DD237_003688 [Peronospora effusa]|uniref:Uncharacterized protein n=1 Tax=Peronospora effusa TaxID=542832 RepID=A0A425CBE9_9STRA|nr:hypothetical protein DD237_003688 [Peronospora effusa]
MVSKLLVVVDLSCAIVDGDNTSMFCNILYTSMLYQVNLNFRIRPAELENFGATEPITTNTYLLQSHDQRIGTWITSGFSTKDVGALTITFSMQPRYTTVTPA